MKKLILFLTFMATTTSHLHAQTACDQFQNNGFPSVEAYFEDFKNSLKTNMPKLKNTRQWARKNNKPQVELATNRLEYWAKKYIQFIDQYKQTNITAVCEKFEKEIEYTGDFVQLTIMFQLTNGINWDKVDYSKYK